MTTGRQEPGEIDPEFAKFREKKITEKLEAAKEEEGEGLFFGLAPWQKKKEGPPEPRRMTLEDLDLPDKRPESAPPQVGESVKLIDIALGQAPPVAPPRHPAAHPPAAAAPSTDHPRPHGSHGSRQQTPPPPAHPPRLESGKYPLPPAAPGPRTEPAKHPLPPGAPAARLESGKYPLPRPEAGRTAGGPGASAGHAGAHTPATHAGPGTDKYALPRREGARPPAPHAGPGSDKYALPHRDAARPPVAHGTLAPKTSHPAPAPHASAAPPASARSSGAHPVPPPAAGARPTGAHPGGAHPGGAHAPGAHTASPGSPPGHSAGSSPHTSPGTHSVPRTPLGPQPVGAHAEGGKPDPAAIDPEFARFREKRISEKLEATQQGDEGMFFGLAPWQKKKDGPPEPRRMTLADLDLPDERPENAPPQVGEAVKLIDMALDRDSSAPGAPASGAPAPAAAAPGAPTPGAAAGGPREPRPARAAARAASPRHPGAVRANHPPAAPGSTAPRGAPGTPLPAAPGPKQPTRRAKGPKQPPFGPRGAAPAPRPLPPARPTPPSRPATAPRATPPSRPTTPARPPAGHPHPDESLFADAAHAHDPYELKDDGSPLGDIFADSASDAAAPGKGERLSVPKPPAPRAAPTPAALPTESRRRPRPGTPQLSQTASGRIVPARPDTTGAARPAPLPQSKKTTTRKTKRRPRPPR